jgi:hypothetical protein
MGDKCRVNIDPSIAFGAFKSLLYLSKDINPHSGSQQIAQHVRKVLLKNPLATLKGMGKSCLEEVIFLLKSNSI